MTTVPLGSEPAGPGALAIGDEILPAGSRAASWNRVKAIAHRHYYVLLRSPHRLFDVSIWPLVDVLLFGSIGVFVSTGAGAGTTGRSAFGYLLAGVLLWHIVYGSQIALSTGFLEETWSRNLLNLMVTPVKEWEYVAGVALFGRVKLGIAMSVVSVGAATAFAFNIGKLGLSLIPITAVLLLVGWMIALFVIGLVLRFGSGAEALAWGILFVLMPLSGVFYPVSALPGLLQPIAQILPTTHAFVAGRAVLDHRGILWSELGIAAACTVILIALSLWWVTAMLATFRRRGFVTRYS